MDCEEQEIWRLVLESLSDRFFTCRGGVPHEHAVLVSKLEPFCFCKYYALAVIICLCLNYWCLNCRGHTADGRCGYDELELELMTRK